MKPSANRRYRASNLAIACVLGCTQPAVRSQAPAVPVPAVTFGELDEAMSTSPENHDFTLTPAGFRAFARARLADRGLYARLTQNVFRWLRVGNWTVMNGTLSEAVSTMKRTFYYRSTPCEDRELEQVRPWWQAEAVWVCAKDHRPEQLVATGGQYCDVTFREPSAEAGCGCGPHLMFCQTKEMGKKFKAATFEEIMDTVRNVVTTDQPFSSIVTMNETVRSGYADLWINRVEFFRTGVFESPDLDAPAALRPRPPYFQGGILSTPAYLFGDSQRLIIDAIWRDLLCSELKGTGVESHKLLEAAAHNNVDKGKLRAESNVELAHTIGCQNCHAEMEYGLRAFNGWLSGLYGTHRKGEPDDTLQAKVFVGSHLDLRAEGPANLDWLGRTLTAQPEFARCMVKRVTDIVYEDQPAPPAVEDYLIRAFSKRQSMATLFENAIVARGFGMAAFSP